MEHRKTVATLSILTFNLFKILAEIYIKFNTATKQLTPYGVSCFVLRRGKDSNPFKCGADEHRRRGLDRADPLFSLAAARENANRIRPPRYYFLLVSCTV